MRRRWLLALTLPLLLGGCVGPSMPTQPEPTGPAPQPIASGALYGRVMLPDGRPATRSTVEAFQLSKQDKERIGIAALTLGIFCLVPGFCPHPVSAKVNRAGEYAFPTEKIKPTSHLTLTARYPAEAGQFAGARVVAQLDAADGTQRAPDLRYWEPAVTVRRTGTSATVAWPALDTPVRGDTVSYSLLTLTRDSGPQPSGVQTTGTSASIDLRPYEDLPTALVVVAATTATVDGRDVPLAYEAGSVQLPSAGPAPSRDHGCRVGDAGKALLAAAAPCPLTDGDLTTNASVQTACPSPSTGSTASGCPEATWHRVCVDLDTTTPVSLVAYRTPFGRTDIRVELSGDGHTFTAAGSAPTGNDTADTYAVRVDPPVPARFACLRDDRFGFAGAILTELSVW